MIKQKLTPWFNGKLYKPARPGVYQLESGCGERLGYQKWDGDKWYEWCETVEQASLSDWVIIYSHQNDDWRGLAEDPSK